MYWYLKVLRNYIDFEGRSRRKEYWLFVLFHVIFTIVAVLLDDLLGTGIKGTENGFIYLGYTLLTFLPGLAVSVRRLHDTGKSGWFILINLIPVIGWIVVWVMLCIEGKPGYNRYGANPKVTEENPVLHGSLHKRQDL